MRRIDRNNEKNPGVKLILWVNKTGKLDMVGVILDGRISRISTFTDIYLVYVC